ncbi:MAG: LuxR family transcriptional regulator [Nocardioides sp.]|uniref:LuxR family transcriptional regulator n=1 Tax=Nocardioides sp. TaxID=35761 RepID=UPI003F06603A
MPLGPAERRIFEGDASALYESIVAGAGLAGDDPGVADGGEHRVAFDLLRELGLVMFDAEEGRWLPVDPSTVQAQVVAPMGLQGAQLIAESADWARAYSSLAHVWRRSPQAARGPFTELRGQAIGPFLTSLVADAESELLTAQPNFNRNVDALDQSYDAEAAAMQRGVAVRMLYQHSARRSTATHRYVAAITSEGAEVRTLDEFFERLIVVDRRIAVIPGSDGLATAVAIREPSVVAYLVDVFERSWERGRPFTNRESSIVRDIAEEQRAMTMRMLIEGRADPAGAKRLGVSPRTYAAYVADLKTEFEVETRFQLGYAMGSAGVTGREGVDERRDSEG